jgi:hypothetical protein
MIAKKNINIFILLFTIILVLIVICFLSYFLLPNNYVIIENLNKIKNKEHIIEINLNKNKNGDESNKKKILFNEIKNKIIKININDNTNLSFLIDNNLKSQNLEVDKLIFIEIFDSDLIIINNNSFPVSFNLELYSKNNL